MGSPPSDDDPRPGQGGWPPPGQGPGPGRYPPEQHPPPGQYPAPTARFPQPGGPYPPGGPGGPYPPHGAGPGYGAPPPGRRSNRGLLIALVVGLVLLAAIAVALVIAFTREGGETVSAGLRGTSSAAPSSSSSPSSSSTSEPAPSSSPSGSTDRTEELLATVPVDFPDCEPTQPAGDGDVAAVTCGPSTTRPGPQTAAFYLYEDAETLDRVFAEEAADVDPMPEGEDCSTAQGVTTWEVDGVEGGEIGCIITESGLLLAWSDRAFGIEGIVTAPGSTQEELDALADWWTTNSDFQG